MRKKGKSENESPIEKPIIYGDPEYTAADDIYSKSEKVNLSEMNDDFDETDQPEQNDSIEENLDVPGSELDNLNEEIGEEDEENNYYSLGGDDHNDLEDDRA